MVLQPQLKVKPVGLKAWMLEVWSLMLDLPCTLSAQHSQTDRMAQARLVGQVLTVLRGQLPEVRSASLQHSLSLVLRSIT